VVATEEHKEAEEKGTAILGVAGQDSVPLWNASKRDPATSFSLAPSQSLIWLGPSLQGLSSSEWAEWMLGLEKADLVVVCSFGVPHHCLGAPWTEDPDFSLSATNGIPLRGVLFRRG
jgi:hypothetical protein